MKDYWPKVEGPHVAASPEQYAAAERAYWMVGDLWRALATDDDATVKRLCGPGAPDAASMREQMQVTTEACAQGGLSTTIRVDASGAFLVLSPVQRMAPVREEDCLAESRWLVVAQSAGEWRVIGSDRVIPAIDVVGLIDVALPAVNDWPA